MSAPPITERHLPHFHRRAPMKEAVRAATTASITISTALNNGDTLDGVTLATGDRVLVKNQSTGSQNGIYVVGASPARDYDESTDDPSFGYLVYVREGTTNGGTLWRNTNTSSPTIGTTALTFDQFTTGSSDLDSIIAASAGQDVADALAGAAAPDSANVFATLSDIAGILADPLTTAGDIIIRSANTDFALSGTMSASTNLGGFPASNANDGSDTTWHIHTSTSVGEWLQCDLGSTHTISSYRLAGSAAVSNRVCANYNLDSSPNGTTWTTRDTATGRGLDSGVVSISPVSARYWRVIATGTAGSPDPWAQGTFSLFGGNATTRLPIGTTGMVLRANTVPDWSHPRIPTKAGVPTDSDVLGGSGAADGMLILDTTNHRLYIRDGGSWKYATLT